MPWPGPPPRSSVIPDLRAVGRLHAQLNRFALRGYGTRLSARLGKGREFDRLREYVRGDEFRDIAWKASARHDKLIVREYRLDRSQDVLLCLDAGHRMAARVAGLTRLDHAVNGAVLLSYGCNRMEDRVGLLSFAAAVTRGPRPGQGQRAPAADHRLRRGRDRRLRPQRLPRPRGRACAAACATAPWS